MKLRIPAKIMFILLALVMAVPSQAATRTAVGTYGLTTDPEAPPLSELPPAISLDLPPAIWCDATPEYGTIAPYSCMFGIEAGETTLTAEISDASGLPLTASLSFRDGWGAGSAELGNQYFCGSISDVPIPADAVVVGVLLGGGESIEEIPACASGRTSGTVTVDFHN